MLRYSFDVKNSLRFTAALVGIIGITWFVSAAVKQENFRKLMMMDPCDVDLIEISLTDVTGLSGRPNYNNGQICSFADTVQYIVATPGLVCDLAAQVSLNFLEVQLPAGFEPGGYINVSGGVGGYTMADYSVTSLLPGGALINFNPNVKIDQSHAITITLTLLPNCKAIDLSPPIPTARLGFTRPNNSIGTVTRPGINPLVFYEPFLNILGVTITPSQNAIPGDTLCRQLSILNNGQFSSLNNFTFVDVFKHPYDTILSFEITPIENAIPGTPIDVLSSIVVNGDSLYLNIPASLYGGPNSAFEVDGGVQIRYCFVTACPAGENLSRLKANWGCDGMICQQAEATSQVNISFNGDPSIASSFAVLNPIDPCDGSPIQYCYKFWNEGSEIEPGEGVTKTMVVSYLPLAPCPYLNYTNFKFSLNGNPVVPTLVAPNQYAVPNIHIAVDTLVLKIDVLAVDLGLTPDCSFIPTIPPSTCYDPSIIVYYRDLCDKVESKQFYNSYSTSFPWGQPIINAEEELYELPSYCTPGRWVTRMFNQSGISSPFTEARDIIVFVRKEKCNPDLIDYINYEYSTDHLTYTPINIININSITDPDFYIITIPAVTLAAGDTLYFSYHIQLNGVNDDVRCEPGYQNCTIDNHNLIDIKFSYKNCYGQRWGQELDFPHDIKDYAVNPLGDPTYYRLYPCPGNEYIGYKYKHVYSGISCPKTRVYFIDKIVPKNGLQCAVANTASTMQAFEAWAQGVVTTDFSTSVIPSIAGDTFVVRINGGLIENSDPAELLTFAFTMSSNCCPENGFGPQYTHNFQVIYECDDEMDNNCFSFVRSCDNVTWDSPCAIDHPVPYCHDVCLSTTSLDLIRATGGPEDKMPANIGLPCDIFNMYATGEISINGDYDPNCQSLEIILPKNLPPCDTFERVYVDVTPGPYLEYAGDAGFYFTDNGTGSSGCVNPSGILISTLPGGIIRFDVTACITDLTLVGFDDILDFYANWRVKPSAEDLTCAEDFVLNYKMSVTFNAVFKSGKPVSKCFPQKKDANYKVGSYEAELFSTIQYLPECKITGNVIMNDVCHHGKIFEDTRPPFILDSIVLSISSGGISFNNDLLSTLFVKGLSGPKAIDIDPLSVLVYKTDQGTQVVFTNPGTWPEEIGGQSEFDDSLFCLKYNLAFKECYDFTNDVEITSRVYYQGNGGCGPYVLETTEGATAENEPSAVLQSLSTSTVIASSDTVCWDIRVVKSSSATYTYTVFQIPAPLTLLYVSDITVDPNHPLMVMPLGGGNYWIQNDKVSFRSLRICALYTNCDNQEITVQTGWACNNYPDDPLTGSYGTKGLCPPDSKVLKVERAPSAMQVALTQQPLGPVDLCDTLTFELQIKNPSQGPNFSQVLNLYIPGPGLTLVPGTTCIAHPDTVLSQAGPGTYVVVPDPVFSGTSTFGDIYQIDFSTLGGLVPSLFNGGMVPVLPGVSTPENNRNKIRVKFKVISSCEFISGSRIYSRIEAVDRCGALLTDQNEASELIAINGLDPRNFNRNLITILPNTLGACSGSQQLTINIETAPGDVQLDEYICITLPTEFAYIPNSAQPINPMSWDLTSPDSIPLGGGLTRYCWPLPVGTPPGVLAFTVNVNIALDAACGDFIVQAFSSASDTARCKTAPPGADACLLSIQTSPEATQVITIFPSFELRPDRFKAEINCGKDDLSVTADIAFTNLGTTIAPGNDVIIEFFFDANLNDSLDPGEVKHTVNYAGGAFSNQTITLEDIQFNIPFNMVCPLYVSIGGQSCSCISEPALLSDIMTMDICSNNPPVCDHTNLDLLCSPLPAGIGQFLEFSSVEDPSLQYLSGIGTEQVIFNGPAGTYNYTVTLHLGTCEITSTCAVSVLDCPCSFDLTALTGPCDINDVFDINVLIQNLTNTGNTYDVLVNGLVVVDDQPYPPLPADADNITIPGFSGPGPFTVLVRDNGDATCFQSVEVIGQDCTQDNCVITLTPYVSQCDPNSGTAKVVAWLIYNNVTGSQYTVAIDGNPATTFNYPTLPSGSTLIDLGSHALGTIHTFVIQDIISGSACQAVVQFQLPLTCSEQECPEECKVILQDATVCVGDTLLCDPTFKVCVQQICQQSAPLCPGPLTNRQIIGWRYKLNGGAWMEVMFDPSCIPDDKCVFTKKECLDSINKRLARFCMPICYYDRVDNATLIQRSTCISPFVSTEGNIKGEGPLIISFPKLGLLCCGQQLEAEVILYEPVRKMTSTLPFFYSNEQGMNCPDGSVPRTTDNIIDHCENDVIYRWTTTGGGIIINQSTDSAYFRWDQPGMYEVCLELINPLGPDCVPIKYCKTVTVTSDNLNASLFIDQPQDCADQTGTVTINFEEPADIASILVCDENGEVLNKDKGFFGKPYFGIHLFDDCGRFFTIIELLICRLTWCEDINNEIIPYPCEGTEMTVTGIQLIVSNATPKVPTLNKDSCLLDRIGFTGISKVGFLQYCISPVDPMDPDCINGAGTTFASFADLDGTTFELNNTEIDFVPDFPIPNIITIHVEDAGNGFFKISTTPQLPDEYFMLNFLTNLCDGWYPVFVLSNCVANSLTIDLKPGCYVAKVKGKCGDTASYDFCVNEAPNGIVHIDKSIVDATDCMSNNGQLNVTVSTNGVIDSLALCGPNGLRVSYNAGNSSTKVNTQFLDLGVGAYVFKAYTRCGNDSMLFNIQSGKDSAIIDSLILYQYTSCIANDAFAQWKVIASSPIDSLVICGPQGYRNSMTSVVSGQHFSIGPPLLFGSYIIKLYTNCYYTEESFIINQPVPAAVMEVACKPEAPLTCDALGRLCLDISYFPGGLFSPDSIIVDGPSPIFFTDRSGNNNPCYGPLPPGTYEVTVFNWDICNNQTLTCIIPESNNQVEVIATSTPQIPCETLYPDSIVYFKVSYSSIPPALAVTRIDWIKDGVVVLTDLTPGGGMDSIQVNNGLTTPGIWCAVIYTGVGASCPKDTVCIIVSQEPCPPDCEITIDTFGIKEHIDCNGPETFDVQVKVCFSGTLVDDTLDFESINAFGQSSTAGYMVSLNDGPNKLSDFTQFIPNHQLCDTLIFSGLKAGIQYYLNIDFGILIDQSYDGVYDNFESQFCFGEKQFSLDTTPQLDYTLEVETLPSPCANMDGKATVVKVSALGLDYDPNNFTYIWKRGFTVLPCTSPECTGLIPGDYTVQISDANGCKDGTTVVTIFPTDGMKICPLSILSGNNCGDCDGEIVMPGTDIYPGVNYVIRDGEGNLIEPEVSPNIYIGLCPGNYTIYTYLAGANSCVGVCDTFIPVSNDGLLIELTSLAGSPCLPDDGRIIATAVGSTPPYNFNLFTLAGTPLSSILNDPDGVVTFTGLAPGEYKVVVSSPSGGGTCMNMADLVLKPNEIIITVDDIVLKGISCFGANDGVITINDLLQNGEVLYVKGPLPSIGILAAFNSGSGSPYQISGLSPGTYQLLITAGAGVFACQKLIEVTIPPLDPVESEIIITTPTICGLNNGNILVIPSGGTGPYQIVWDNPALIGFNPAGLGIGQYGYTIIDNNGCSSQGEAEIFIQGCSDPCPVITVEIAVVEPQCGSANGNALVTVSNDADNYNYLWSTGETTREINNLSAGIYQVIVTSKNRPECSTVKDVYIGEIDGPLLHLTAIPLDCNDPGGDAGVSVNVIIPIGQYTYTLSIDGNVVETDVPSQFKDFKLLQGPGKYCLTLTDENGCHDFACVDVGIIGDLDIEATASQFSGCINATGRINITVSGGVGPYSYYLNGQFQSTAFNTSININNLAGGEYLIEVTDVHGCRGLDTTIILTGGGLMINPGDWTNSSAFCSGDLGKIIYTSSTTDNSITYYLYRTGGNIPIDSVNASLSKVFSVPEGGYWVKCVDVNGCIDVLGNLLITAPDPLDFYVWYNDPTCTGENEGKNGLINIIDIVSNYNEDDLVFEIIKSADTIRGQRELDHLAPGTYEIRVCYSDDYDVLCCKSRVVTLQDPGCRFDLALRKIIDSGYYAGPFGFGDTVKFSIQLFNQGTFPVSSMHVVDYLPEGMEFIAGLNPNWDDTDPLNPVYHWGGKTLFENESDTIFIYLKLKIPQVFSPASFVNQAEISYAEDDQGIDRSNDDIDNIMDSDPNNNGGGLAGSEADNEIDGDGTGDPGSIYKITDQDNADPAFIDIVDLALSKYVNTLYHGGPYRIGDTVKFDIKIFNQGIIPFDSIEVIDYLGGGLEFLADLNPGWDGSLIPDRPVYHWGGDTLYFSEEDTISIYVRVKGPSGVNPYLNRSEIQYGRDTTGNDDPGRDGDSNWNNNPDDDGGGVPGGASDDEVKGDGSGGPGMDDPALDEDDEDPAFLEVCGDVVCPPDTLVTCIALLPAIDTNQVIAGSVIHISNVIDSVSLLDSICINQKIIYRIYEATNTCTNINRCIQIIIIRDTIIPDIVCPNDTIVDCTALVPLLNVNLVRGTDNCFGTVLIDFVKDSVSAIDSVCINQKVIYRKYLGVDDCMNSNTCTQKITVRDTINPVLTCPKDTLVTCTALIPAPDASLVTGIDNCLGNLLMAFIKDSTSVVDSMCINQKVIYRKYSGVDDCNNSSICFQKITVKDTIPPVIPDPGNIDTVECGDIFDLVFPIASDNCGGFIPVHSVFSIKDSTCPGNYTLLMVFTASDSCGNTTVFRDSIIKIDTINPSITCPPGPDTILIACGSEFPLPYTSLDSFLHYGGSVFDKCCVDSVQFSSHSQVVLDGDFIIITNTYTIKDCCSHGDSCIQIFKSPLCFLDLALKKEVDGPEPFPAMVGGNVPFKITVYNQFFIPSDSIKVIDYLPSIGSTVITPGWTNNGDGTACITLSRANGLLPSTGLVFNDSIVIYFTIKLGLDVSMAVSSNTAEIFSAQDTFHHYLTDIDSDPDGILGNDPTIDNIVDQLPPIDEDDEDPALFFICSELVCTGHINASMDEDCGKCFVAADFLQGLLLPDEYYTIELFDPSGKKLQGNCVDRSWLGYTLTYKVTSKAPCQVNSCWGTLTLEDKMPPFLGPIIDTVTCFELNQFLSRSYKVPDNCSDSAIVDIVSESFTDYGCDSVLLQGVVHRLLIASDIWGNTGSLNQTIYVRKISLDSIWCARDTTIDCSLDVVNGVSIKDPSRSGAPHVIINGEAVSLWPNNVSCKLEVIYRDEVFALCGKSYKILRQWYFNDWCTGRDSICRQWIQVIDRTIPQIRDTVLPVYYSSPHDCGQYVDIPLLSATDCNTTSQSYVFKYVEEGVLRVRSGNLPATHIWLPVGNDTIEVSVLDACNNLSKGKIYIRVQDNTPPTPVCDEYTQVTVDPTSCWSSVAAKDLDNGSHDNCCNILHFAVASMESISYWTNYWNTAIEKEVGTTAYWQRKPQYDSAIVEWINCYVFADSIHLTECGTKQVVLRVYEACGVPLYDPHVFPCSNHAWFCYNSPVNFGLFRADFNFNWFDPAGTKSCDYRPDLGSAERLMARYVSYSMKGYFNPKFYGATQNDPCSVPFYFPQLPTPGRITNDGLVPGTYCSKRLYNDCMVNVLVDDKQAPVVDHLEDVIVYCDNAPEWANYPDCDSHGEYYNAGTWPGELNYKNIVYGYYGGGTKYDVHLGAGDHNDPQACEENKGWAPIYCKSWLYLDSFSVPLGDRAGPINPLDYFETPVLIDKKRPLNHVLKANEFTFTDNCALNDATLKHIDNGTINGCSEGWIQRIWTIEDQCGNKVTATQKVIVKHRSDFEVLFPRDTTMTCDFLNRTDTSVIGAGSPKIFDDECEQIGLNYKDEIFTIVVGAEGGNPLGNSACYKIVRTWTLIDWCIYDPNQHDRNPDVIVDDRHRANSTNRSCVYRYLKDNNDGYMKYIQIIKVIDEIRPKLTCTDQTICIEKDCTTSVNIPLKATDNCSDVIRFRVDMTRPDGTHDIRSDITAITGSNFSPGLYSIQVIAKDQCGNEDTCGMNLTIVDCKKPTPYCLNGIATVVMPGTGSIQIWAKDFDKGSSDNCTSSDKLKFSFSKDPLDANKTLTCANILNGKEQSVQVEIWVTDEAGKQDFCSTYLLLQDNGGQPGGTCTDTSAALASITGRLYTENQEGVEFSNVEINGLNSLVTPGFKTLSDGRYSFNSIPMSSAKSISASRDDNPMNGVSTLDLVLIQKQVLGTEKLKSPYYMIAADVNSDDDIDVVDLVELRKLILGIYDKLPNSPSWKFIPKSYVFQNTENPWKYPSEDKFENIIPKSAGNMVSDFIGIKIGDVNNSAQAHSLMGTEVRNNETGLIFEVEDQLFKTGDLISVPFRSPNFKGITGFQGTLQCTMYNGQRNESTSYIVHRTLDINPGLLKVNNQNFGTRWEQEGLITMSWNTNTSIDLKDDEVLFTMNFIAKASGRLSEVLRIGSQKTVAESYEGKGELGNLSIRFIGKNGKEIAGKSELFQNYPNPFDQRTVIGFNIAQNMRGVLKITDITGRSIKVIEQAWTKGYHEVWFDRNEIHATGILYYSFESLPTGATAQAGKNFKAVRKMVIVD
ncbi:MAG: hypothetical protein ABI761_06415 [Saprospiraceae bacterium]